MIPVPAELIAERTFVVRGQKVILDSDLAALYEVPTGRFNEAVKRNVTKFPSDFMWTLSADQWASLRSQIATLKTGRGQHRKYPPTVFTEHGAIMAATLLNSPHAVQVSVYVVRAFVRFPANFWLSKDDRGPVNSIQYGPTAINFIPDKHQDL